MTNENGAVCILRALRYMVDGCFGASEHAERGIRFSLDTGAGLNLIRPNVLPQGWKTGIDGDKRPQPLNDDSGNLLDLGEVVRLTTRPGNLLFHITFIVTERLGVDAIVWSDFMNGQGEAILFRQKKMKFRKGTVLIVGQGHANTPPSAAHFTRTPGVAPDI